MDAPSPVEALYSLCDEYFVGGFDDAGTEGEAPVAEDAIAHALAAIAEEGEVVLDGVARGAVSPCLVAQIAQCPYDLGDAVRVMAQDMAVCFESAGIDGLVGGCAEMLAGMPEVPRPRCH